MTLTPPIGPSTPLACRERGWRWLIGACALVVCVLLPLPAHADRATAELLFREGRELMEAGQTAAACEKFAASMAAEHSVGAILNLALCHEKQGKTASAWAEYAVAADLARHAGQTDREQGAEEAVARLAPALARLTISVDERLPGLIVLRNQTEVLPAAFGSAVPVDSGEHVIEARAIGRRPWTTTVQIASGPSQQTVVVPALEPADGSGATGPGSSTSGAPSGEDGAGGDGLSGMEIGGITTMVIGIAGLGVGIVSGVVAMNKQQALEDDLASGALCPGNPTGCAEAQDQADSDIKPIAHLSTAGLVIGGTALVGGLVLFLLAPDASEQTAYVLPLLGPSNGGVSLTGTF